MELVFFLVKVRHEFGMGTIRHQVINHFLAHVELTFAPPISDQLSSRVATLALCY